MPVLETTRIFLSSTAEDLVAHRLAAAETIDSYGQSPVRMESFGAMPGQSLDVCRQLAAQADALVVIVAHRYGWVPGPEEGGDGKRSITWHEVDAASEAGKPVFVYLVDPEFPWDNAKEQDRLIEPGVNPADVAQAVEQLAEFKKHLSRRVRETFRGPDDLAKKISQDLGNWLVERARGATSSPAGLRGTIHIDRTHISSEHYSDQALARFTVTNLTGSQRKLRLTLAINDATESENVRLRKAGAVLQEFDLEAELGEPCEIDLLGTKPVQIVLGPKETEAFRLSLRGEEGMRYGCKIAVTLTDLEQGEDLRIDSDDFSVEFPIRSAEVLRRRRQAR